MTHQSPINIEQKITAYDEKLARNPIIMIYDMDCCSKIKNTGHTFQVDTFPNHNSCNIKFKLFLQFKLNINLILI